MKKDSMQMQEIRNQAAVVRDCLVGTMGEHNGTDALDEIVRCAEEIEAESYRMADLLTDEPELEEPMDFLPKPLQSAFPAADQGEGQGVVPA